MHVGEQQTDEALVRGLLEEQFPEWARLPVERVPSTGTDNALYRLGDDMARTPSRPSRARFSAALSTELRGRRTGRCRAGRPRWPRSLAPARASRGASCSTWVSGTGSSTFPPMSFRPRSTGSTSTSSTCASFRCCAPRHAGSDSADPNDGHRRRTDTSSSDRCSFTGLAPGRRCNHSTANFVRDRTPSFRIHRFS
jgi:hypothetical protein